MKSLQHRFFNRENYSYRIHFLSLLYVENIDCVSLPTKSFHVNKVVKQILGNTAQAMSDERWPPYVTTNYRLVIFLWQK